MNILYVMSHLIFLFILLFSVQTDTYYDSNNIDVLATNWQNDSFAKRASFTYNGNVSTYEGYFFESYYKNYAIYEGICENANRLLDGSIFVQNETLTLTVNESVSRVCIYYREQPEPNLQQSSTFLGVDVTSVGYALLILVALLSISNKLKAVWGPLCSMSIYLLVMGFYDWMFNMLQLISLGEGYNVIILWTIYSYVFFADMFLEKLKKITLYLAFLILVGVGILVFSVFHTWIFGIVLAHTVFGIGLASFFLFMKWFFLMKSKGNV